KALKNELLKGLDLHSVVSRLPHKIEENLHIQRTFRSQLQQLLEEQIVRRYLFRLLDSISSNEALPEEVLSVLRDRLSGRDMISRLKGMCDVFLFEYGGVIDELGRTIMAKEADESVQNKDDIMDLVQKNADRALEIAKSKRLLGPDAGVKQMLALGMDKLTGIYRALTDAQPMSPVTTTSQSDEIDRALECYKAGLLDYTRKQQRQINKFARRGIKNYFEELEQDLLAYFESVKDEIAKTIMKQLTTDIDAELNAELQKQKVIKEAYQVVTAAVSQGRRNAES